MWCAVSTLGLVLAMPNSPKDTHPVLVTQLQDFAWTESTLEQRIQVGAWEVGFFSRETTVRVLGGCDREEWKGVGGMWEGELGGQRNVTRTGQA